MSLPSPEKDDGAASMDDDHLDLSPDGEGVSSDDETIRPEREVEQEQLEEDVDGELGSIVSDQPTGNGVVANRYRQLLRNRDDVSEAGSSEGLPRRAGSPIDSLLSIPDDSPSVQVSFYTCYDSTKKRERV